jgi:hypothetical protein
MDEYVLQFQRELRNGFYPPKVDWGCRVPEVMITVHSNGFPLDEELIRPSNCSILNRPALNSVWIAAPFRRLPLAKGAECVFLVRFEEQPVVKVQRVAAIAMTHLAPDGYSRMVQDLNSGDFAAAQQYLDSTRLPSSIPLVLAKSIFMQTLHAARIGDTTHLSELFAAIPKKWLDIDSYGSGFSARLENLLNTLKKVPKTSELTELQHRDLATTLSGLLSELNVVASKTASAHPLSAGTTSPSD